MGRPKIQRNPSFASKGQPVHGQEIVGMGVGEAAVVDWSQTLPKVPRRRAPPMRLSAFAGILLWQPPPH